MGRYVQSMHSEITFKMSPRGFNMVYFVFGFNFGGQHSVLKILIKISKSREWYFISRLFSYFYGIDFINIFQRLMSRRLQL